jgi:hypothetical protein
MFLGVDLPPVSGADEYLSCGGASCVWWCLLLQSFMDLVFFILTAWWGSMGFANGHFCP